MLALCVFKSIYGAARKQLREGVATFRNEIEKVLLEARAGEASVDLNREGENGFVMVSRSALCRLPLYVFC